MKDRASNPPPQMGDAPGAEPFDPLATDVLADTLARAFEVSELRPLPPARSPGSGVYALYYQGVFPLYQELGFDGKTKQAPPIYVGKANPRGARAGGFVNDQTGMYIFNRLGTHARSIDSTSNLSADEFRCRYLVTSPLWAPFLESLLINRYSPLWNGILQGFGSNATGGPRSEQRRSDWDTLHPGRGGAGQGTSPADAAAIEEKVRTKMAEVRRA